MKKSYGIQEVSESLGISKDTLRYYDKRGLLSPARKDNRYRCYSNEDLIDLMNIQVMKYVGFSLGEIKEKIRFHRQNGSAPECSVRIVEFLRTRSDKVKEQIAHLDKVSRLLDEAARMVSDGVGSDAACLDGIIRHVYQEIRRPR